MRKSQGTFVDWSRVLVVLAAMAYPWPLLALAAEPAQQPDVADVLRAKRIEIVDEKGAVKIVIAKQPNGSAGICVLDGTTTRASLGVLADGSASINLFSKNGKALAAIWIREVDGEGTPAVTLSSVHGEVLTVVDRNGVGVTAYLNGSKVGANVLCIPKERSSGVTVTDKGGVTHGVSTDGDRLQPLQ